MNRILIVDDDVELTEMLREYLEPEGFAVDLAHDGQSCLKRNPIDCDLIVLDVMLPAMSGFEILKVLRQKSQIPVILLTARSSDVDRIVGLEIGADDYVAKPVNPRELVARIRAVLRRSVGAAATDPRGEPELVVGEIRLNPAARAAWRLGEPLELTTAEFNLLECLLRHSGHIVTRGDLSAAAFGRHQTNGTDRNVDTLVSKVRRKLGPGDGLDERIKTVRNVGYIFALPTG
jgi:two-component system response regulator CpxR